MRRAPPRKHGGKRPGKAERPHPDSRTASAPVIKAVVNLAVKTIIARGAVGHALLLLIQRHNVGTGGNLLVEIAHVHGLAVNLLIQPPELKRRKLGGQHVVNQRGLLLHGRTYPLQSQINNVPVVKRQLRQAVHGHPAM